ncbi:MAG: hypothetical protein JWL58_5945 [Streptosporangiaceae bacterium]|jgi:hypothetical protein|nr:hypothetical protein [Streptosporangiaceae bacterium]
MAPILTTPPDSPDLSLPESGWDLHIGRGSRAETTGWRPALEVHTGDGLIDVAVAGGLDQTLLRGALRGRRAGRRHGRWDTDRAAGRWALAWGHLPDVPQPGTDPATTEVIVEFRTRRTTRRVIATAVAGAFWVAEAPGGFRSVAVSTGPRRAAARLRRYRPAH